MIRLLFKFALVVGVAFVWSDSHAQATADNDETNSRPTVYEQRLQACNIKSGDVQAEPYFNNGQLAGFRYVQIRPGSAYSRAGFKPGDILIEQNGIQLRSPDDIVKAFEAAKNGDPQISTVLRSEKRIQFKMKCSSVKTK